MSPGKMVSDRVMSARGKQEGSFVGCAAGAAKDVVIGTAKGLYNTAKDAGGAVLDKAGVEGFEGHTERTTDRVNAVVDGGKKVIGAGIDAGGAVMDKAGADGFEGHSERTAARGEAIGKAASDEWSEFKAEVKNGDSCALGERVGTGVGVGATVVVGGGALYKGGKVLAKLGQKEDSGKPEVKTEAESADKKDVNDVDNDTANHVVDGGVEYKVTTDRQDWGETRRETGTLAEGKGRRQSDNSKDGGKRFEATTLDDLGKHGIDTSKRGVDIDDIGRIEMRSPPQENVKLGEVDLETQGHVVEMHKGKGGKREQVQEMLNSPQLNRGKDVILYSPKYSRHGTEMVDGKEVLKGAMGPNGERAQVVRDAGELAEIIKSSK